MPWITTSDISKETWRYLFELANPEYAYEQIVKRQGKAARVDQQQNYRKQARQLRVALLQAKEYFDAAGATSTVTSPNHLYYGLASLGTAIMLFRGDGTHSLDYLRGQKANRSHGVGFTTGATESTAARRLTILEETRVEVEPAGHFANWYATLPPVEVNYSVQTVRHADGTGYTHRAKLGSESIPSVDAIAGSKTTLLELLQTLPDLFQTLFRYGASIPCSRIGHTVTYTQPVKGGETSQITHEWLIHGAKTPSDLQELLSKFGSPPGEDLCFHGDDLPPGATTTAIYHRSAPSQHCSIRYPSVREDINLNVFAYAKDINRPEFVDVYLSSFGLSMLSRYYPDIWIACLESHCLATKLIDRFVDVMLDKAPLLAARVLTDEDLVIAAHRPHWYS